MQGKVNIKVYLCLTCGYISQFKAEVDVRWVACPSCGDSSFRDRDIFEELENYWNAR